jgi:hypothetical protein
VKAEIIRMLCRRQFAGDDLGLHGEWLRLVESWRCLLRAASMSGHPDRWLATDEASGVGVSMRFMVAVSSPGAS